MPLGMFNEALPETFVFVYDDSNSPGVHALTPTDKIIRRVDAIMVTNNDTIDHIVRLRFNNDSVNGWIGSAVIPAGTGYDGTPAIDLQPLLANVNVAGWALFSFNYLEVGVAEAVSAGKGVWFVSLGGLF